MDETDIDVCRQRQSECELESLAFNQRLKLFGYSNWITVIVPSLLAIVAASTFANVNDIYIGIAALTGAILATIHKTLDCGAYQAECRRLIQAYAGLATKYRSLHEVLRDDWQAELRMLDEQLASIRENAAAKLPNGYKEKLAKNKAI